jgi:uncharacterized membrane protein
MSALTNLAIKHFRDRSQFLLFSYLLMTSIFGGLMVLFRLHLIDFQWNTIKSFNDLKVYRTTDYTFFFFFWNLFLAWIPYWFALGLNRISRDKDHFSYIGAGLLLLLWLLFFPNAPYIVTDLLHLKHRPPVPLWYDVMLMMTFAWSGLMLGYSSLFEVQYFLERHFSKTITWSIIVLAIGLAGFGVFMGRFQRLNSWDIATKPFALIRSEIDILMHPLQYSQTLGVAVILSAFMLLGYLTINALRLKN